MTAPPCKHEHVAAVVCDQTAGVECLDCRELIAVCWDGHIPEALWNRVCDLDPRAVRCAQNRIDVCALCSEPFDPETNQP